MADTCQATSLYRNFYSPDIVAIGSSEVGESAYSVRIPRSHVAP